MNIIRISTKNIKLDQFLKWANIVQSGGEAKLIIREGIVMVNGELEIRRGRNLVPGDVIEVEGQGKFKITQD
ncbi:MAG: RNA-binding S4 domain-containing protein [Halanaerobiales bacterium]|nr:RNA-binding S4 domain-containing protein [Halanaerobiales bacterium]